MQFFGKDLEEFVQGSGEAGVLVFSISTLTNLMDDEMADMIATALSRVPLRVVWKFVGDRTPLTLGNNTLLASWLPKGDLLGTIVQWLPASWLPQGDLFGTVQSMAAG